MKKLIYNDRLTKIVFILGIFVFTDFAISIYFIVVVTETPAAISNCDKYQAVCFTRVNWGLLTEALRLYWVDTFQTFVYDPKSKFDFKNHKVFSL